MNDPESSLIGSMYQSVRANDDLIVTDGSSWFWDGCGLPDGTAFPGVVQGEYDRYVPSLPGPTNVGCLRTLPGARARATGPTSPTTPHPGAEGSFATGMASWVFKLSNTTEFPDNIVPAAIPGVTDVLLRAMENLYGAFGAGPASKGRPSGANWSQVYPGAAARAPRPPRGRTSPESVGRRRVFGRERRWLLAATLAAIFRGGPGLVLADRRALRPRPRPRRRAPRAANAVRSPTSPRPTASCPGTPRWP